MRKSICFAIVPVLLVLAVSMRAQGAAQAVQFKQGMTVQSLASYPDSAMVRLLNGKRMTGGDLRRWDLAAQRMRAVRPAPQMPAFRALPAKRGTPVNNRTDLLMAIKNRPATETLQLPSGRRVTVAQLRAMQPYLEQQLGRSFEDITRPPSGQPIPITAASTDKAFWKDILSDPGNDNKVLISLNGKQVTVGDLKQYLAQRARAKSGGLTSFQVASPSIAVAPKGGAR